MGINIFKSKEKKQQEAEAAAAAKEEAEYEAKFAAKQERKKAAKIIVEMDKSIQTFTQKAAEAKAKGYTTIYKQCVSFIRTAKAKQRQAEEFVYQIDAMLEMHNMAKNSSELLNSISNVMNTLGKISLDKSVLMANQRDFQKAQMELDKQTDAVDSALSSMGMVIDASDELDMVSEDDIEAEIDAYITDKQISSASFDGENVGMSTDVDVESMKRLLGE